MAVEGAALARTQASSRVLSTLALLRSMSVSCLLPPTRSLRAPRGAPPDLLYNISKPFPKKLDLWLVFF